jgi:hypothetical protein
MLRDRASKRLGADSNAEGGATSNSLVAATPAKHINFWEELEAVSTIEMPPDVRSIGQYV